MTEKVQSSSQSSVGIHQLRKRIILGWAIAIGLCFHLSFTTPLTVFSQAPAGSDWPQYRGPKRDGVSSEKGWFGKWPADGPKVLWKASVGTGFSSIAIHNGRAYTMGNAANRDTVYCLNANTGKPIWKHSYAHPRWELSHEGGPAATPTVDGDAVYTFSKDGRLFCLNANSGEVVWSKSARNDFGGRAPYWGYSCSPLITGKLVIVEFGLPGASLVAFDKESGEIEWSEGDDGIGYSSPILCTMNNTPCVAAFNAFGLVIRNVSDGKEVYRYPWKTEQGINAAMPVVFGDKFFLSSGYNVGCALIQITKENPVLWKNRSMRNHFSASVLYNGHIYGFDESELKCLDVQNGATKWTQDGLGKGSLMIADGKLIILSERGELVIATASPTRFQELARAQILGGKCWTVPVLSKGRIYARNADGDLVCVDVTGKA